MTSAAERPVDFRPERTHLLVGAIMTVIMLIPIGSAPLALGWTLIFPAAYLWWILRARTRVGAEGITARYAFRAARSASWDELAGVGFTGPRAVARLEDGSEFVLPAVTFNSIPALAEASGGRITDALSAAREAVDDMVTVTRADGTQRLVTREEFAALVDAGRVRPMASAAAGDAQESEGTEIAHGSGSTRVSGSSRAAGDLGEAGRPGEGHRAPAEADRPEARG